MANLIYQKEKPKIIKLKEGDSELIVIPNLPDDLIMDEKTFNEIWNLHPKKRGQIKIYGKVINVPRWQQSYGKNYYFSNMDHESKPIEHEFLKKILAYVKKHSKRKYNQLFINWYDGGYDYIGAHSDDESQLVSGASIYSFSYGQTRRFIIKSKNKKSKEKVEVALKGNTLVIMAGKDFQKNYTHQVPKELKIKGKRINITLRLFKE
jgi:alkylated DNA repair dioxygenase AlkB